MKARAEQAWAVEEFFELFKTPWEFFRNDQTYDVVIVTTDDIPAVDKGLLLIFRHQRIKWDEAHSIESRKGRTSGNIKRGEVTIPIYAGMLPFGAAPSAMVWAEDADGRAISLAFRASPCQRVRFGFDLFDEVQFLLSEGQPVKTAAIPSLDLHIRLLRECIVEAGVPIAEIPPTPAGHNFVVCLTHDIDFVGIRRHVFDHSMWGFVYRATIGSIRRLGQKKLTISQVFRNWGAVASLPLVYLGILRDFWEPFDWYLKVEEGLPATYFLIPIKHHAGDGLVGRRAKLRASAYDVTDISDTAKQLVCKGHEVAVHGIDAWNSAAKGEFEAERVAQSAGKAPVGVRMHWLKWNEDSPAKLEDAGFDYDSTLGYNETIGYRAGTSQAFRPKGSMELLELPMHIQDGALFYPQRMNLSDEAATQACNCILDHARQNGGAVTVIWHDRSHGPERFWGDFYRTFVDTLKRSGVWFGTCADASHWFRVRRGVKFESIHVSGERRIRVKSTGGANQPAMRIRVYGKDNLSSDSSQLQMSYTETCWDGRSEEEVVL